MENQMAQSWQTLTFGTWNVRGLSKKKIDVVDEIERENEDIVVLTETKIRGVGREEVGNYVHLYSAITYRGGLPSAGVSLLIKKELCTSLEWEGVNERIIWVKLSICNCKIVVVGVYWVDECRPLDTKNRFENQLKDVISQVEDNCELIILGDFNAWVGKASNNTVIGEFGVEKQPNDNGIRLIKLCAEFNLKIQNTFFNHQDIHKYTWYGSRTRKSLVDYCITRQNSKLNVQDVVACRWLECGTDHVFLEATISFPGSQQTSSKCSTYEMPKYRTYLLFSKNFRTFYKEHLESSIDLSISRTTDEMYQHLKESIRRSAEQVLGFVDKDRFGEFLWDSEILELRRSRAIHNANDTLAPDSFIDAEIKNGVWEGICADVNSKCKDKKYGAVISILEELLNKTCDKENPIDITLLENCFTETRVNFIKSFESSKNFDKTDKDQLSPVSVTDVELALDHLEYSHYPSEGGLNVKLLKYSSTKTKILLRNLIQRIFNGENIPEEINEMYIYFNSNGKNQCKWILESMVQVTHPIKNILCTILKSTLESMPSIEKACNFCEPKLDATFALRLILQKNATKQEDLVHFLVIDMANIYGSVPLVKLYETLHSRGIGRNLIQLIQCLTEGTLVKVMGNENSKVFHLSKGLKSTSTLAPLLYKIYISEALNAWKEETAFQGISIGKHNLSFLYSEDKLVIFSYSKENLESMFEKLEDHFERIGLRITTEIVKYMGNGTLRLGNETIQGESSIDYQGSILQLNGGNEQDIARRTSEIKNMIGLLHPSARDERITDRNKRMIFNTIVKGYLTHGCETWTVTEPLKKEIDAVELRYWKWCCEMFPEKLTSTKIYEIMKVNQKVSDVIILKKAAWYTRVKQMSPDHWARLILEWEPEGKRKAVRPRTKWVDGVEEFIANMGQYSRHFLKNGRFARHAIESVFNGKLEQ